MRRPTVAHRDLTPHAVEPSQALVTLDGFVALVAPGGAVPLHPEVVHDLQRGRSCGLTGEREESVRQADRPFCNLLCLS